MSRGLLIPQTAYIVNYPEVIEMIEKQTSIFWTAEEVNVSKDVHDILTNLTEAEKHGVITTLKLFTKYELIVGDEYWNRVGKLFQHPADIQRMASTFSFFELGVHGPFYSKINEALGLATEDFYSEYANDPILKQRISMLEQYAASDDVPTFLMALAMIEGVVLYSNFAFLKHFQSQGKNKITNIVRGINFSARDEGLHSLASAWLFRTLLEENKSAQVNHDAYLPHLQELVANVREHEFQIVDKIFSKGEIEGITATQLKNFIDSRINLVANNLGYTAVAPRHTHNPIADYFYDGINNYIMNDFFAGQGREYSRNWDSGELEW